jgi:hypothetical protein
VSLCFPPVFAWFDGTRRSYSSGISRPILLPFRRPLAVGAFLGDRNSGVFLRHAVRIRRLGIAGLVRVAEADLPGLKILPGPWPQSPQKQEHACDHQKHHCSYQNHCIHPASARFTCRAMPSVCVSLASECSTCRSRDSSLTRQMRGRLARQWTVDDG